MKNIILIAVTVASLGCATVGVAVYARTQPLDERKLATAIAEETVSIQKAEAVSEQEKMQERICKLWADNQYMKECDRYR